MIILTPVRLKALSQALRQIGEHSKNKDALSGRDLAQLKGPELRAARTELVGTAASLNIAGVDLVTVAHLVLGLQTELETLHDLLDGSETDCREKVNALEQAGKTIEALQAQLNQAPVKILLGILDNPEVSPEERETIGDKLTTLSLSFKNRGGQIGPPPLPASDPEESVNTVVRKIG